MLCKVNGVEKKYRGACVLGPVELEITGSVILGIRGHNGAGKTTLLKLLSGALKPDKGKIEFDDTVRGYISYVPQELSLYESLSVNENLRFWGLAYGLPSKAIASRSRWLLEKLDISEKGNEPVKALSGGMKRRAHLASALMVTPKLLLLDEPTAGTDADSAELILSMLLHLKNMGCGIVMVSHNEYELRKVCRRVITMKNGLIVSEEALS